MKEGTKAGQYQIRETSMPSRAGDKTYKNYSLTVPREIAAIVPDGAKFVVELTEEGILYRIVPDLNEKLPNWAKKK